MKLNLQTLVVNATEAEFEFPLCPGMKVKIAYTNKTLLNNIRTSSLVQKFNVETGLPYQELDTELYLKNFVKQVVTGWSGLTYAHLSKLVLIDESNIDKEAEIDFDLEAVQFLMNESGVFDTWVVTMAKNLENFRK